MDEETNKTLVAGMLTIAFYSNQPPLESKVTIANVPPESQNREATLRQWQGQESFKTLYQTFETFKKLIPA